MTIAKRRAEQWSSSFPQAFQERDTGRMSTDEIETRTLRQADYDAYFKDLMESEGLNVEEAAEQSIESISSQYDVFNLFLYRNKRELDEKVKVESRCVTIEKAGKGTDSFINANFAFQGLLKILKDSDEYTREGIWHIFESRFLLRSLICLLRVVPDDEDAKEEALGEIDSDEEDEDEAKILQTIAVLEFSKVVIESASSSPKYLHNVENFLTVDCDMAGVLKSRLDEDVADARYEMIPIAYNMNPKSFK